MSDAHWLVQRHTRRLNTPLPYDIYATPNINTHRDPDRGDRDINTHRDPDRGSRDRGERGRQDTAPPGLHVSDTSDVSDIEADLLGPAEDERESESEAVGDEVRDDERAAAPDYLKIGYVMSGNRRARYQAALKKTEPLSVEEQREMKLLEFQQRQKREKELTKQLSSLLE